jgi:hypothetical protein
VIASDTRMFTGPRLIVVKGPGGTGDGTLALTIASDPQWTRGR